MKTSRLFTIPDQTSWYSNQQLFQFVKSLNSSNGKFPRDVEPSASTVCHPPQPLLPYVSVVAKYYCFCFAIQQGNENLALLIQYYRHLQFQNKWKCELIPARLAVLVGVSYCMCSMKVNLNILQLIQMQQRKDEAFHIHSTISPTYPTYCGWL